MDRNILVTIGFITIEIGFDERQYLILGDIETNHIIRCTRCGGDLKRTYKDTEELIAFQCTQCSYYLLKNRDDKFQTKTTKSD